MPVVVGVSYPFGIRFPHDRGPASAVALNHAKRAPVYSCPVIDGARFHVALYDRSSLSELVELHRLVFMALPGSRPLIKHTTDGRSFFTGPSFWGCFAKRVAGAGLEWPDVAHPCARCHSYFGCVFAQKRQHEMYHREGWEVFYHGRHGLFATGLSPEDEDFVFSGRATKADLDRVLGCGTFHPDREKIKAEVMRLIRHAGAHRCPLFSPLHLDQQVKRIPTAVPLAGPCADPEWRFLNCAIHGPAAAWRCYGDITVDAAAASLPPPV